MDVGGTDVCRRWVEVVGVSLSESHTSVTSLHLCVCVFACLLGPTTYRKSLPALDLRGLCHTFNSKTTQ